MHITERKYLEYDLDETMRILQETNLQILQLNQIEHYITNLSKLSHLEFYLYIAYNFPSQFYTFRQKDVLSR